MTCAAAAAQSLTIVTPNRETADASGTTAYGPNVLAMMRRAAETSVQFLEGAWPAAMPVEQPTRHDFVVDVEVAQALGITVPATQMLRSGRVWSAWFASFVVAARPAAIVIAALPPPASPADITPMLDAAKAERIQALVPPILRFLGAAVWQQITARAIGQRGVTRGSLLSRGAAVVAFGANVAELVRLHDQELDRVLRGADPATTPFLQPTRWDVVINQRLARTVGWPAPLAVSIQATEIVQ